MASGTQPRLPGVMPTPKAARAALAAARVAIRRATETVDVMKEAAKGAAEMRAGAELEHETAADDFARDETPGAHARYCAAVENLRARRLSVDGAKLALKEARAALKAARRLREAADEDLLAIAQGRRAEN